MKNVLKFFLCLSLQISLIITAPLEIDMRLQSTSIPPKSDHNTTCFLTDEKHDVLTIETCIGNPSNQCFDLVYDTASFHFWLPSHYRRLKFGSRVYNNTSNRTYIQYNDPRQWLHYITGPHGYMATDDIQIGNIFETINMNFVVDNTTNLKEEVDDFDDKSADGIIGFGRDFIAEASKHLHSWRNNSILDVLRETGMITRKMFSQKFTNKQKTEAKLYIGDLHEDFVNNTNLSSCGVVTKDPWLAKDKVADKWNCRLSHVILGDNKTKNFDRNAIPINSRAVFDSTANNILAPHSEIGPFKNYFEERNCTVQRDPAEGVTVFVCDDLIYQDLVDISFVMNGTAFYIPPGQMFQPFFNLTKGVMAKIFFVENLNHWVLGQNFMKNLHILFDAEKNIVSFSALDARYVSDVSSSTTDADFVLCDYYQYILLIMLVLVVVMFTTLFVFLVRMRKSREEEKSNQNVNTNYPLMDTKTSINQV